MKSVSQFRFKQFAVSHHRSAMKVGVDGVLIGCWADTGKARRILDVGTGCGLIALMMAQRCKDAFVTGIDIDKDSVEEAVENVEASPWSDRIRITEMDFSDLCSDRSESDFDLIISNPPYFDSGVKEIITSRERARHQGVLSPGIILEKGLGILNDDGMIAMVVPSELSDNLEYEANELGYELIRKCLVRGHRSAQYKRVMLQWRKKKVMDSDQFPIIDCLTLEESPGVPTDEYRKLGKDFYLRF